MAARSDRCAISSAIKLPPGDTNPRSRLVDAQSTVPAASHLVREAGEFPEDHRFEHQRLRLGFGLSQGRAEPFLRLSPHLCWEDRAERAPTSAKGRSSRLRPAYSRVGAATQAHDQCLIAHWPVGSSAGSAVEAAFERLGPQAAWPELTGAVGSAAVGAAGVALGLRRRLGPRFRRR